MIRHRERPRQLLGLPKNVIAHSLVVLGYGASRFRPKIGIGRRGSITTYGHRRVFRFMAETVFNQTVLSRRRLLKGATALAAVTIVPRVALGGPRVLAPSEKPALAGVGVGDMGCHHLNTPFRALKLKHPVSVSASSTKCLKETAPLASIVTYEFPAREGMPPVRVIWYDGGLKPTFSAELEGRPLPAEGTLYAGEEGKMLGSTILSGMQAKKFKDVPKTLPRRPGTWGEWYEACRGGEQAGCKFDWAGPLTEFVLLGNIAIRTGKLLQWDADSMRITNHEPANAYLHESSRSGWPLET